MISQNNIRRGSEETEQEKEESDDEGGHGQRSVASAQRHSGSHPATTNLLMAAQCTTMKMIGNSSYGDNHEVYEYQLRMGAKR